ncbi:cellulose synthase subunit BcsC-related outer membrane protein [Paraburkholderia mimosarum]|uniref:cellulose synthase subunit BcsC-related outer membrane protein n=1 Tax=Paraburkholderia mimosarum TaxID=312026 RepID=UPI0039C37B8F
MGPGGGRRWCAVWLCGALSGFAHAAQDNVLDVEQTGTQGVATHWGTSPDARRSAQPRVTNAQSRAGDARVEQAEQQGLIAPVVPPDLALPARNAKAAVYVPSAPDERPLWNLLKANELTAYDAQVARLTREYPSWTPAQALAHERERRQREEAFKVALGGGPQALRALLSRAPEEFGCDHIEHVWQAADAFSQAGDADAVFALYRAVVPTCAPAANRMATLYRAVHQLSEAQVDALIDAEANEGHRSPEENIAFERLRYERAVSALAALPPGDPAAAAQLAVLAPAIRARRDGEAATLAGWIAFAHQDLDAAADWFDTALSITPQAADASIGLAQVRVSQRDWDAADALLMPRAVAKDARARNLRGQIALARADEAYRAHRYAQSLLQLDEAEALGMPQAQTAALRGWNLYALKKYAQAEQVFRERYEASHDEDSAEGLALSRRRLGKHGTSDSGALGAYEHALNAQQLFYQKAFVAAGAELHDALGGPADAARITQYVPADLQGVSAASVSAGLTWNDHVGGAGEQRLDTIAPTLRAEWIDGTLQYEIRYRELFLNAGTASLSQRMPGVFPLACKDQAECSPAGSVPALATNVLNAVAEVPYGGSVRAQELQAMVANTIWVDANHVLDWSVSFGATQGGAGHATLNGQATIGQRGAWGAWSAYVGNSPVRDSLLSWRGLAFANTSAVYGPVTRWASGAQARWQVTPRWNISAAAEAQWLTGTNVVGNEGASADLSAGYDFRLPELDYLSAGPVMHYLTYRRNENFYTPGWGGYYSPQQSLSAGLALQVLSKEGQRLQWRGGFEAGWNASRQSNEPCLPLLNQDSLEAGGLPDSAVKALTGATCYGSHDKGPYAHAQVSVAIKFSPRLQSGALVDISTVPGRDKQAAALVFVRYFIEPRAAVFSRDLPRNARDAYLQLDDDHH